MFTKMKKTMNNMSRKDWLVASLWLLTFILLIVFVIVSATLEKGTSASAATLEHSKDSGKLIYKNHAVVITKAAKVADDVGVTYANAMASVGTIFAISIFSALATTVWFKFLERKQGGKHG